MKKRRVATIITVSLALILISSVTYAAGKKRESKPKAHGPEAVSEEEALKAELLAATEEGRKELPGVSETKKKNTTPDLSNVRSEES